MVKQDTARPRPTRSTRPRYSPVRKVCVFCAGKIDNIDYKDAVRLRNFISDRGRIASRHRTGTCAKHQRVLATAIKRARHLALLPFAPAHLRGVNIGPV